MAVVGTVHSGGRRSGVAGFTLLELLVVIAVIAVLAGLLLPALGKAKSQAKKMNEMSSAHQLMLGWMLYANDHQDRVIKGYRHFLTGEALPVDRTGNPVPHPINCRYPWRLAPWLGKSFGVMYANENASLLRQFESQSDPFIGTYAASVFPSLGINATFVGGDDLELPPEPRAFARFGEFCVLRTTDARNPANLLVFGSARGAFEGKIVNGFYQVRSPYFMARRWSQDFNEADGPEAWGNVHPRFSKRAVTGMVDGHVEAMNHRELQDMQHWSNQADRPDWTLMRVK
ncbi:MAG TPA: hypothetical protein DCE44_12110 [Verrucomicrobiales bacterium]|nr:hypothetical protein [Verrucomicrobiales bacterium]